MKVFHGWPARALPLLLPQQILSAGPFTALRPAISSSARALLTVDPMEAARFRLESIRTALDANHDVYLRNVWTTLGFLFVIIGWLITSESARQYIGKSRRLRYFGVSFMIFAALCHAYFIYYLHNCSAELVRLLERNSYAQAVHLEPIGYRSLELPLGLVSLSLALDETVFLLLVYLIFTVPENVAQADPDDLATLKVEKSRRVSLNLSTPADANRASRRRR